MDQEGNIVPGKMIDVVVDGNDVYIVSRPMIPAKGQIDG